MKLATANNTTFFARGTYIVASRWKLTFARDQHRSKKTLPQS